MVMLNANQLRNLAQIIYTKEVNAISQIKFGSEPDLASYLRDCRKGYESMISIIDSGEVACQFGDEDHGDAFACLAREIHSYIVCCCNSALQNVRNYSLRLDYLGKIRTHADELLKLVDELKNKATGEYLPRVERLAQDAHLYRNDMLEFTRMQQSPASRSFSEMIKKDGKQIPDLLRKYQKDLNYGGRQFSELSPKQQLHVYSKIIDASGRGNAKATQCARYLSRAGVAVFLFTAAMSVWGMFSSEQVMKTAVHDAVVGATSIGGAMVGEVIGCALTQAIGASALTVMVAGIVTGIVGAFILGAFVGDLMDTIFGSGEIPTNTEHQHCIVAPMPDCVKLAHQIAHH